MALNSLTVENEGKSSGLISFSCKIPSSSKAARLVPFSRGCAGVYQWRIGRGHSAPHPIKAVGKKRIYCWGGIQRIAPRSSFFSRNSRYGFCSGTRTGIRSFGRGFDGSGRSLRSSGIRLRSILRGFWIRSTRFRSQ